ICLVAARLVDRALAPELRFERPERDAVRGLGAIAAAFAYPLVDHHAPRRVGLDAALPASPLLGGAGLVVEKHRESGNLAQLALHAVELLAVPDLDSRCEADTRRVLGRFVGDDDDFLRTFRGDLPRDLGDAGPTLDRLASGHRHRVVV